MQWSLEVNVVVSGLLYIDIDIFQVSNEILQTNNEIGWLLVVRENGGDGEMTLFFF